MMMIQFFVLMIVYITLILFQFCLKFNWYGSFLNFHFTGETMRLETNVSDILDDTTVLARWLWDCWWVMRHGLQLAGITLLWFGGCKKPRRSLSCHAFWLIWSMTIFTILKANDNLVSQPSCAMLYKNTVCSLSDIRKAAWLRGHNSLLSDSMIITISYIIPCGCDGFFTACETLITYHYVILHLTNTSVSVNHVHNV